MATRWMFGMVTIVAVSAIPAGAIEMFTNFNNGTELGTQPLGIDPMGPVRYHGYPRRWRFSGQQRSLAESREMTGPRTAAAHAFSAGTLTAPTSLLRSSSEPSSAKSTADGEDRWIRSSSFLPAGGEE